MTTMFHGKLSGRCANGAQRGAGTVVHLVPADGNGEISEWGRALCGAKPGRRAGNGFIESKRDVTCEKCARRVGVQV